MNNKFPGFQVNPTNSTPQSLFFNNESNKIIFKLITVFCLQLHCLSQSCILQLFWYIPYGFFSREIRNTLGIAQLKMDLGNTSLKFKMQEKKKKGKEDNNFKHDSNILK